MLYRAKEQDGKKLKQWNVGLKDAGMRNTVPTLSKWAKIKSFDFLILEWDSRTEDSDDNRPWISSKSVPVEVYMWNLLYYLEPQRLLA